MTSGTFYGWSEFVSGKTRTDFPTPAKQNIRPCHCLIAAPNIYHTYLKHRLHLNSFLNSCANPVALYCVSGVFRQHFHRYLCCRPMVSPNRLLGHSTATNVCDTSFTSTMRRNTIKSHSGGGGGGVDYNGSGLPSGPTIKCEGGSGAKNGTENNSYWHQNSGCVDSVGRKSPTQNIITMEKR